METKYAASYEQLARQVGSMVLFNNLTEVDANWFEGVENYYMIDSDGNEVEDGDYPEVYQWYVISQSGYDYLKKYTTEIIGYSELLGIHYWGITHFGTVWSHVFTDVADQYI